MKIIKFLSILFSLLTPFIRIDKDSLENFQNFYIYITPLIYDNTTRIFVSGLGKGQTGFSVTIKLYNDYYPDGVTIAKNNGSSVYDKVFEYDNTYTRDQNTIEINYGTRATGLTSSRHEIPRVKAKSITLDDDHKVIEEAPNYVFSPLTGWKKFTSSYDFDGFNDFYIPTFYHKLDFSDFKVKMDQKDVNVFNCEAELYIQNYNATFYSSDEEGYSQIPLKAVKSDNNTICFEPSIDLYVNKETLEMSLENHNNYVKTRHFYLPRNGFRNQSDYDFTIVFKNFGSGHLKLKHAFKFNALTNTIGNCINSEYCIINS